MKAVMYIRVSTEEQKREGYSIDSQRSICLRWLADHKHEFVDEYVDEGVSSKNLKRREMQRMIRDIPLRKFDLVIFWRMNRLTRVVKDKVALFELFDRHRINLKSMTEEIDTTTAAGRMTTNILMSVAQGEREQTSENVHATMSELALKGHRNGAVAPYGYDLIDKQLVINEAESAIVKRIFTTYQDGRSFIYIAKLFNRERIPKGTLNKWAQFTVKYILSNPVYCGKLRWNHRKLSGALTGNDIISIGSHDPIVNVEEFERVQELIAYRSKHGKKLTSDYPYTTTIRCARCGYGLIGGSRATTNGRSRFYKCTGRFSYGLCDLPVIAESSIDDAFLRSLVSVKNIQKLAEMKEPKQDREEANHALRKELEAIQKRQTKFQIAFANDAMTLEQLKKHKEDDRQREGYIHAELKKVPTIEKSRWTREEIIQQLRELPKIWRELQNDKAKKMFITEAFERIVIDTDSVVSYKSGCKFRANVKIHQFVFKNSV